MRPSAPTHTNSEGNDFRDIDALSVAIPYCQVAVTEKLWNALAPRHDLRGRRAKIWRRHPDSNRGIRVLQTLALPLGYAASKKLWGEEL